MSTTGKTHEASVCVEPQAPALRNGDNRIIYRNAHLVYNPQAGKLRRDPEILRRTLALLAAQGHTVKEKPTPGPQSAASIVRDSIDSGADLIIAAGGDGTINEVANGMIGSDVPLAILPGGTANVLACELGTGTRMEKAARRLSDTRAERIAVGRLDLADGSTRHFLLMAGIGLDAEIVYNISAPIKARLGKVAYWIGGFRKFGQSMPEFDVTVQGKRHRTSFALASRVRNYGGDLTICRQASLMENDFEVALFSGPSSWAYLKYFSSVLLGTFYKTKGITALRAKSMDIAAAADPRIYIQVDGEYVGRAPARISIVPDALCLLVPSQFKR